MERLVGVRLAGQRAAAGERGGPGAGAERRPACSGRRTSPRPSATRRRSSPGWRRTCPRSPSCPALRRARAAARGRQQERGGPAARGGPEDALQAARGARSGARSRRATRRPRRERPVTACRLLSRPAKPRRNAPSRRGLPASPRCGRQPWPRGRPASGLRGRRVRTVPPQTQPVRTSRPMATPNEDVVGKLNSFLRGEISAVETYRQALDRVTDPAIRSQLQNCEQDHEQRIELLRASASPRSAASRTRARARGASGPSWSRAAGTCSARRPRCRPSRKARTTASTTTGATSTSSTARPGAGWRATSSRRPSRRTAR